MLNNIFLHLPLPAIALAIPLIGMLFFVSVRIFDFTRRNRMHKKIATVRKRRLFFKVSFLLILTLNYVVTFIIWLKFQSGDFLAHALGDAGWTAVLRGARLAGIDAILQVDSLGATAASTAAFIALVAGLRSLADKKNLLTPSKATFFLTTLLGVQGIFYSGGLFALFLFIAVSQVGASVLVQTGPMYRYRVREYFWYYASRIIALVSFLTGCLILYSIYRTDRLLTLSSIIEPGPAQTLAFIFMIVPPLFLFMKSASNVPDSSRRCMFIIRAHAAFFAVLRILFFIFGPMPDFAKVPWLFMVFGIVSLLLAFLLLWKECEPFKFAEAVELYLKGFMLTALGIGMSGLYSANAAAEYGYGALESAIGTWLIFVPLSAILSIAGGIFKQRCDDKELWETGGLRGKFFLCASMTLLSILGAAGLPPTIGFITRQLLYRSANYINPFLTAMLIFFSFSIVVAGVLYIANLTFLRPKDIKIANDPRAEGDIAVALPMVILLILMTVTTFLSGKIHEAVVSSAVDNLMNRGHHVDITQQSEEIVQ